MEYDETTCWTAWELRARGLAVPESVPDEAWIRRCDVQLTQDEAWIRRCDVQLTQGESSMDSDGVFRVALDVTFLAPFQWVELTLEIPDDTSA